MTKHTETIWSSSISSILIQQDADIFIQWRDGMYKRMYKRMYIRINDDPSEETNCDFCNLWGKKLLKYNKYVVYLIGVYLFPVLYNKVKYKSYIFTYSIKTSICRYAYFELCEFISIQSSGCGVWPGIGCCSIIIDASSGLRPQPQIWNGFNVTEGCY